jgi:hypothetical protein
VVRDLYTACLADAVDGALLIPAPPELVDETTWRWEDAHGCPVTPDQQDLDCVNRQRLQEYEKRTYEVGEACEWFERAWAEAFRLYDGQPWSGGLAPIISLRDEVPLYLEPHIELPDHDLITHLAYLGQLPQLIVLTARHELGYLWRKVEMWQHNHAHPWLDEGDWGLITARQRVRGVWDLYRLAVIVAHRIMLRQAVGGG